MFDKFKSFGIQKNKVLTEKLTSKRIRLCGTLDCLVKYKGKIGILDFKTSKIFTLICNSNSYL